MIGKIIGALAGAQAAQSMRGVNGPVGAILGATSVAMVRRMSLPALVAVAAGGYMWKRMQEKGKAAEGSAGPAKASL